MKYKGYQFLNKRGEYTKLEKEKMACIWLKKMNVNLEKTIRSNKKTTRKVKKLIPNNKCLNYLCNNELPEHYVKRQKTQIHKFWFCVDCKRSHESLYYRCFRECCDNLVEYQAGATGHSLKYCSPECKQRMKYGELEEQEYKCKECKKSFLSTYKRHTIFCTSKCCMKYHQREYKRRQNAKNQQMFCV